MRRTLTAIFRALSRLVDPAPREIVFDRPEIRLNDSRTHQLGWVNGQFYIDGKPQS